MGRRRGKPRVRQHVNPLSFRAELEVPDWEAVFPDPTRPLEVDVGCGHGAFLVERAKSQPGINLVGLEIRKPFVERVRKKLELASLTNGYVLWCNANQSFRQLFATASLARVYVHFPDPWFKKRHHKRRVLTPEFMGDVAACLQPQGEFRFMTDFQDYAEEVANWMQCQEEFQNPFGERSQAPMEEQLPGTHRELWHGKQQDRIHRYVWRRVSAGSDG